MSPPPINAAAATITAITSLPESLYRALMLSDEQPGTRMVMKIAWSILGALCIVDAVGLSMSRVRFAASNWADIRHLLLCSFTTLLLCLLLARRLANNADRIAGPLRETIRRIALVATASLIFGLMAAAVIVFCHLGVAVALPLQDARLAAIDHRLGFDWIDFVKWSIPVPASAGRW